MIEARRGALHAVLATAVLWGCVGRGALPPPPAAPESTLEAEAVEPLDVLDEGAASVDPQTRGYALAHLVATSDDPAGGTWAQRGLHDPEPWVQRRVIDALLERVHEPEAVAILEGYVARDDVDPYVRASAALALARAGHTGHAAIMAKAWQAEGEAWRVAPLALAAAVLGDEAALEPLVAAIERGDVALEVEFVRELGDSGLTALIPALREGTGWVEEELRLPYAAAQLALGDAAGESVLRKALSHPDEQVRLEALDYLVQLEGPAATSLLHKARGQGASPPHWYAVLALAARGEADPVVFVSAMAEGHHETRQWAVRFAAEAQERLVGTPARKAERYTVRAVELGLADDVPAVVGAALRAAGEMGLVDDETWMRQHLLNEYASNRVEAAGALRRLESRP